MSWDFGASFAIEVCKFIDIASELSKVKTNVPVNRKHVCISSFHMANFWMANRTLTETWKFLEESSKCRYHICLKLFNCVDVFLLLQLFSIIYPQFSCERFYLFWLQVNSGKTTLRQSNIIPVTHINWM